MYILFLFFVRSSLEHFAYVPSMNAVCVLFRSNTQTTHRTRSKIEIYIDISISTHIQANVCHHVSFSSLFFFFLGTGGIYKLKWEILEKKIKFVFVIIINTQERRCYLSSAIIWRLTSYRTQSCFQATVGHHRNSTNHSLTIV